MCSNLRTKASCVDAQVHVKYLCISGSSTLRSLQNHEASQTCALTKKSFTLVLPYLLQPSMCVRCPSRVTPQLPQPCHITVVCCEDWRSGARLIAARSKHPTAACVVRASQNISKRRRYAQAMKAPVIMWLLRAFGLSQGIWWALLFYFQALVSKRNNKSFST